MLIYVLIIALALIFRHIGDHDYRSRGFLLGGISVMLSLVATFVLHWGWFGVAGLNVALFLGLLAYNMFSADPPTSGSGF